jgi:hypothetical protein
MTKARLREIVSVLVDDYMESGDPTFVRELLVNECGITWDEASELGIDYLWPDGELAFQEMYG